MNNINKVGRRNHVITESRRYSLSDLISESYKLLYDCESDSNLYKLTESHIKNLKKNPDNISALSKDLCTLKGLYSLGESAIIRESDIPSDTQDFTDEMNLSQESLDKDRDVEKMDEPDIINEEENFSDDESSYEEENEEEIEDLREEDEAEEEITKDELIELKKHLKEMRKAKKMRESKKSKVIKESRSWKTEKSSMSVALKHFRESSTNKAFYNTFSKMSPRLKESKPLTLQESLLLYKASNSAMTQLAIELERNPEFIYTFRECTSILSEDTKSLLECIKKHKSPNKSLVESLRTFSDILLESEEEPEDYEEYEEEEVTESEESEEPKAPEEVYKEETPEELEETPEELEETEDEDISDTPEEDTEDLEEEEIESEETPEELEETEDEDISDTPEEDTEDLEEEEDSEITDEEAMELKKKLDEIRRRKASR